MPKGRLLPVHSGRGERVCSSRQIAGGPFVCLYFVGVGALHVAESCCVVPHLVRSYHNFVSSANSRDFLRRTWYERVATLQSFLAEFDAFSHKHVGLAYRNFTVPTCCTWYELQAPLLWTWYTATLRYVLAALDARFNHKFCGLFAGVTL